MVSDSPLLYVSINRSNFTKAAGTASCEREETGPPPSINFSVLEMFTFS